MDKFYLFDYLKKNNPIKEEELELLKYEIDQRLYYYGDHFKCPKERLSTPYSLFQIQLKYFLRNIYLFCVSKNTFRNSNSKIIISNAYFSVNKKLSDLGFNVLRPVHNSTVGSPVAGNYKIIKEFIVIDKKIRKGELNDLLIDDFLKKINLFINNLTEYYKSIGASALIIPNDIAFFEKMNIEAFKRLKKPSFIFLHGLPGRYNIYDDNLTDYSIVWGEKIKQNYIQNGFKPETILVSGHPFYERLSDGTLRHSLDDILIISKSINGAPHRNGARLADRGSLIVYLNQIADILKRQGVKKTRLRVHPSENINWYHKFIDQDFFTEDKEALKDSLEKSTLVIGPTSTVFLESMYYGVNYLVYEPVASGVDLSGYSLVPPFDKSDPKVPVANNEIELEEFLVRKTLVDKTIFNDYINTPFDANCIIDKINLSN